MSVRNVEVVRIPLAPQSPSRRSIEERLGLRFPRALAFFARLLLRLPAHSRLRRTVIRRAVQQNIDAYNRRDFEAVMLRYHPDVEEISPREFVELGFDPVYRGYEAGIRYRQRWYEEWGEFQLRAQEVIDLGNNRLLVLASGEGQGLGSGVALAEDWTFLSTFSAGRAIRTQLFLDRAEALRAAGLTE